MSDPIPGFDLVGERGDPIRVEETKVLAVVLGLSEIEVRAGQVDEHGAVGQVFRPGAVVESKLLSIAPAVVRPEECGVGRSSVACGHRINPIQRLRGIAQVENIAPQARQEYDAAVAATARNRVGVEYRERITGQSV